MGPAVRLPRSRAGGATSGRVRPLPNWLHQVSVGNVTCTNYSQHEPTSLHALNSLLSSHASKIDIVEVLRAPSGRAASGDTRLSGLRSWRGPAVGEPEYHAFTSH
eukprot:2603980-Prymnesium_polylepis.1